MPELKKRRNRDGRKCRTLVPREKAQALTLQEAIDVAMEHTKQTNNETLFLYNPETQEVLSSITEGECHAVEQPIEEWGIGAKGTFHTHSLIGLEEYKEALIEVKQALEALGKPTRAEATAELLEREVKERVQQGEEKCQFSSTDLHTDFVNQNRKEIKVGCPFLNEIVTIQYNHKILDQLLFEIVRSEEQSSCNLDIGNSITMWADRLKELFPQYAEDIEKSRYEWITKGFPSILTESKSELRHKIEQKVGKLPMSREKWKRNGRTR